MVSPSRRDFDSATKISSFEKTMHVPGSIIGNRYQIIQKLGREEIIGTYLAKDLQTTGDSRCAVEQISPTCDNDADWQLVKQHLLNKIEVLKRLGDHPQIPQYYNYCIEERRFYLVREYIDGDNLEQEVDRRLLEEAEAVYLIQDVLRILDFLHKTNVIHRDIQPVHLVKRKRDQKFVLINFAAIRELESTVLSLQGEMADDKAMGNWVYIAPEQKQGNSYFSSDIYALARTIVYALTGRSPQELEQTGINWQSHCHTSSRLKSILSKMMLPSIEERYSSALEVLQDLKPLLKIKQVVGGRYSITDYLGGNAGTETYIADNLHRQYQSPCLIKQIELLDAQGDSKIKIESRFAEELSTLERLGYHEQIPQLWDHFAENDEFYLVQEYILGENLAQKIRQQSLSPSQVVSILVSTLNVLSFIHQNGIIHRHIQPSNLLIRHQDQQVVITDFGILEDIKALSPANSDSREEQKNYVSYEQIAGRTTVNSDLYALGMTAVEALTRTKPSKFARDEQTGKLLWQQNLNIDRRLARIIDRMIDLDLGQRYQSAERVALELQKTNPGSRSTPAKSTRVKGDPNQPGINHSTITAPVRSRRGRPNWSRLTTLPILTGFLGLLFLLGSVEFAFPTLRPIYYWYRGKKALPTKPQSALDTFTKAIDIKPKSELAWSGRGDALFSLGRYSEALEAYSEAAKLDESDYKNWQSQGDSLYQLDNFSEAIAAYDRALSLEKDEGEIYNRRGQALYELEDYQGALTMQESALAIDPLNPQFMSDRAKNLLALGKYYDALTVLNRVQAAEPANPKLWQKKSLVLRALERPQEAERVNQEVIQNYQKMLQGQPQNEQLWKAQADFFAQSQMYRQAANAYNQAIELKPNFYQAWLGKGEALTQLGESTRARAALDKAIQLRPKSHQAWQAKGAIDQQQQNYAEAIANYDQGITLNANYAPLWRERGLALSLQGNYIQAVESLTKAVEITPTDQDAWIGLAEAWDITGQDQKALSALDRAIELKPEDPVAWQQKGNIYTKNGQYNEACALYRQSRQSAPEAPVILESMRNLGCRMQ